MVDGKPNKAVSQYVANLYWCSMSLDRKHFLKEAFLQLANLIPFSAVRWVYKEPENCEILVFEDGQKINKKGHAFLALAFPEVGPQPQNVIELYRDDQSNDFDSHDKSTLAFIIRHLIDGLSNNGIVSVQDTEISINCHHKKLQCLTDKEKQVSGLIANNLSISEIARRQGSSVRTVEKHMQSIYKKLGTKNKKQTLAFLLSLSDIKSD